MRRLVLLALVLALTVSAGAHADTPDAGSVASAPDDPRGLSGMLDDLGAGDAGTMLAGLSGGTEEAYQQALASVQATTPSGLFARVSDPSQPAPTIDGPALPEAAHVDAASLDATRVVSANRASTQSELDDALAGVLPDDLAAPLLTSADAPFDAAHDLVRRASMLGGLPPLPSVPLPGLAPGSAAGDTVAPAHAGASEAAPRLGVRGDAGARVGHATEVLRSPALLGGSAHLPGPSEPRAVPAEEHAAAALLDPIAPSALVAPAVLALLSGLLVVPFLYHRVRQESSLDHPARRALYDAVVASPGSTIQSASRAAGLTRGTAVHHLRILARHRLILQRPGTKEVHLFPNAPGFEGPLGQQLALLARPRTREIASWVAARPSLTRTEVAEHVGITPSTLDWHLGQLLESGLVVERLEGRRRALVPGEGLSAALCRSGEPARGTPSGVPPALALSAPQV